MTLLRSIRSRIIVFAITATFIPSLGVGLLSFWQIEAQTSSNVTRELRALSNYASHKLEHWVDERINEVRVLSASNTVIEGLAAMVWPHAAKPGKDPVALSHYLRSVQGKLDTILELTVMNTAGEVVASSTATPIAVTLPQNWPQTVVTAGIVIVSPQWDEKHAAATLSIAVPVLSYDNALMGALVAVLDLGSLQPHLRTDTNSPLGEVLLLDQNGRALLGSHAGVSGLMLLDASLLQQLRAQPGESMVFQELTHREVIGLADVSTTLLVTIVAERDHAQVVSAWVELRNQFLALVSMLLLVVAVVAFRLGRSIVVRLQQLIDAVERIADGDLNIRLVATQNDELGHLTQAFSQMADKLRHNHDEIVAANQAMQRQNQMLEALSVTDGLTGLYNRSKLDMFLSDQLARFKRNQRPFSLLMLDIDYFKTLNDNHGHLAGDEILKAVAGILARSVRSIDCAARYGGDEFIIIFVETSADAALRTAERIRSQVECMRYSVDGQTVVVTVSIGVVQCQSSDMTSAAVFARADNALYQAKHAGRNLAHLPPSA